MTITKTKTPEEFKSIVLTNHPMFAPWVQVHSLEHAVTMAAIHTQAGYRSSIIDRKTWDLMSYDEKNFLAEYYRGVEKGLTNQ